MKIGLYLAYWPQLTFSQNREGLGRYWAKLVQALSGAGHDVVISCTPWSRQSVLDLLSEYGLTEDDVQMLVPRKSPVVWRVWEKYCELQGRPRKKRRGKRLRTRVQDGLFNIAIRLRNMLAALLLALAMGVLGIVAFPFSLLYKLLRAVKRRVMARFGGGVNVSSRGGIDGFLSLLGGISGTAARAGTLFFSHLFSQDSLETIRLSMAGEMRGLIAAMRYPPDVWYCPMAYWPEFALVPGVKVLCFPDIVSDLFAEGFSAQIDATMTNKVRQSVRKLDYFICYSEYQKTAMLVNHLGKDPDSVRAIDLFINESAKDLAVQADFYGYTRREATLKFARRALAALPEYAEPDIVEYLCTPGKFFSFQSMRFIFYPSHIRPSKNVLNLIRAYAYLLREREMDFKLVLTGKIAATPEVRDFVYENRLQYDVLSFFRVDNLTLAALYASADLVVTPTLFEGGFPMTFGEGMSLGTPSVFSRIPQVEELVEGWDLEDCLFDPFDVRDIARAIVHGIENRDDLVRRQQALYASRLARSDEGPAAQEYIDAFEHFIEKSRQATKEGMA